MDRPHWAERHGGRQCCGEALVSRGRSTNPPPGPPPPPPPRQLSPPVAGNPPHPKLMPIRRFRRAVRVSSPLRHESRPPRAGPHGPVKRAPPCSPLPLLHRKRTRIPEVVALSPAIISEHPPQRSCLHTAAKP